MRSVNSGFVANSTRTITEHKLWQRCHISTFVKKKTVFSFAVGVAHDGLSSIKGHTPLVRCLHYVDFNRIWIVPFCHAFYLGVFKDFLNAVFAKKSAGTDQVS